MKRVLLALLGLILLLILSYFCFKEKADSIRQDLLSSTNAVLEKNKIHDVNASLVGDDVRMQSIVRLAGEVPSQEVKSQAALLVKKVDGVSAVDNQLTLAAQTAKAAPEQAVEVIKEAKKETDVNATTEKNTSTDKASEVAKAAPAVAKTAKKEVAKKEEPRATALDTNASYKLNILKSETNHLTLEGSVASKKQQKALLLHAEKLFGKQNVTNKLKVKKGAPKNWENISTFAIDRLNDVDYGDIKLRGKSYEFTGHLPSPSSKEKFLDNIRAVMSDPENNYGLYKGDYIITAPIDEPAVAKKAPETKEPTATSQKVASASTTSCQSNLDTLLKGKKVLFEFNVADIKKDSFPLLDSIYKVIKECKVNQLEITGHTDASGPASYNKLLSQKRADSVKAYFVKLGFNKDKLHAIGLGEERPIAANDTIENRAKNRRIEFKIKGVK